MTNDTNLRISSLKASLAERRVSATRKFEKLKESAESGVFAYASRDAQLQAMLQRIRINSPMVVHGEATRIEGSGLPEYLMSKKELA